MQRIPVPAIPRVDPAELARRATERRRAVLTTPEPVYAPDDQSTIRPARLAAHDGSRVRAAAVAARRLYPGPVGDVVAEHLLWHADTGWATEPTGQIARLCDYLLGTRRAA